MPYPNFRAGQTVTALLLNKGKLEYVTNPGSPLTNATTTMANATGLSFSAEASSIYRVQALISYDAPTATDAKFAWTGPSGFGMTRNILAQAAGTTTNIDTNMITIRRAAGTAQTVGGPNATANAFSVYFEDVWMTTVDAGTVQFQFAAAAAGIATLQPDSYIVYQQVAGP